MFNIKESNYYDEECDDPISGEPKRIVRYETCSVIYGKAGYFQKVHQGFDLR
jgi:hypothetical protein